MHCGNKNLQVNVLNFNENKFTMQKKTKKS